MKYLGNYAEDYSDLNFKFSTHKADGTPYSLAGGVISVYKSNSTTESVAGVTLTADFDGRTGLNNVKLDLSADAFYAAGYDYAAVITVGTVNTVSVVGTVVALFSIDNRYMRGTDGAALASTTATATNVSDAQTAIIAAMPASVFGPGATSKTILISNGTIGLVGAGVWLTSDLAGTNVVAGTLYTNDNGLVSFDVDVGSTYYVWTDSALANFTNPLTWVVT
jgi:hypothetical protein